MFLTNSNLFSNILGGESGGGGGGPAAWGSITGVLSSQTDLQNALNLKENTVNKGAPNGYAGLDGSGIVPISQLPSGLGDVGDIAANTAARHTQGTDLGLDTGGSNPVTAAAIVGHINDTANPHGVTAAQVGAAAVSHTHDAGDITTGTFVDARISSSSITQHVGAIDHDTLLNFVANEHIDWTSDVSPTAINLNNIATLVGDAGAGGTEGLVPAPGAGDAASGFFLKADGTWALPAGGGGGIGGTIANTEIAFGTAADTIGGDSLFTFDSGNNYLGIGIASPTRNLHLVSTTTSPVDIFVESYNNTANSDSTLSLTRGRGTESAPSDVLVGDLIGCTSFRPYVNGSLRFDGSIGSEVEALGATWAAIGLVFHTRNAAGVLAERMRINAEGAMLFNGLVGTAGQVLTTQGAGASPTWEDFEIGNLDDVTITSPVDGHILTYTSAGGGGWVNAVNPGGGGLTGAGVAGRMAYWTSATNLSNDDQLNWNDTLHRLSIGLTTAQAGQLAMSNNDGIYWRNVGNNGDMGVYVDTSNRWVFSPATATQNVEFVSENGIAGDNSVQFRFGNSGAGTAKMVVEGAIEAHDTNSYGDAVALAGAVRIGNNKGFAQRNVGNNGDMIMKVDTGNNWAFSPSSFTTIVDFVDDIGNVTADGIQFRFANSGTGTAQMQVEGSLEVHQTNGHTAAVAQSGAVRLANNQGLVFRNVGNNGDMGIVVDPSNRWEISPSTGLEIVEFVSENATTGAGQARFRFGNSGTGTAKMEIEGWLELFDSNGYSSSVAQSGIIRLPNNKAIVARNVGNNGDIEIARATTGNRLQIAGLYDLPAAVGGAGTVLTDAAGDGNLSWAVPGGGATPGIDDVLAEAQALTANRTIALGANDFGISSSTSGAQIDFLVNVASNLHRINVDETDVSLRADNGAVGTSRVDLTTTALVLEQQGTSPAADMANITLGSSTMNLLFGTAVDLQINGASGASGQVLTSQGSNLPPQWATPAAPATPGLDDVANVGQTLTANTLNWSGVVNWLGAASSSSRFQIQTLNGLRDTLFQHNHDSLILGQKLNSLGTELNMDETDAFLRYLGTSPVAPETVSIQVLSGTIGLNFGSASDLAIDGDRGSSGEVLTSQGSGTPPIWGTSSSVVGGTDVGDHQDVDDTGVSNGSALVYTGSQYEDKFVPTTTQKTRQIYGRISTSGSIQAGSSPGFTITKIGTGAYQINYLNSFVGSTLVFANCRVFGRIANGQGFTSSGQVNTFQVSPGTPSSEDNVFDFLVVGEDDPV